MDFIPQSNPSHLLSLPSTTDLPHWSTMYTSLRLTLPAFSSAPGSFMSQSAGGSIKPQKAKPSLWKAHVPPWRLNVEGEREAEEGGGWAESDFKSSFKSVLLMSCSAMATSLFSRVFHSTCMDGLGWKTKKRGKCRERETPAAFLCLWTCRRGGDSFSLILFVYRRSHIPWLSLTFFRELSRMTLVDHLVRVSWCTL